MARMVVHRLTIRRFSRATYHCFTSDPPRYPGNRRNESSTTAEVGQKAGRREAKAPSISFSFPRSSPEAPPRLSTALAAVPWAASADAIKARETGPRGSWICPTHGRGTRSADRGREPGNALSALSHLVTKSVTAGHPERQVPAPKGTVLCTPVGGAHRERVAGGSPWPV